MSGISSTELLLLCLIGLIVLGPARLPQIANKVGSWLGQARRMTRVMKRQLEEELNLENKPSIKPSTGSQFPPKSAAALNPEKPTETEIQSEVELDDTYSPAHADDEVGTGVGEDEGVEDTTDDPEGDSEDKTNPKA